ncbi:MAG: DNA integrity scanning protein DisA nucleotide-binding domain protein [Roseburia sp.]|nr:DNA integrity scanning protein DisA nucleotide-binding domain protein [Roseburia sp.]
MTEDILELFDKETGAISRDNEEEIAELNSKANEIRDEFAKISKHKQLGQSMQELLAVELYVLDDTDKPKYVLSVFGKVRDEVEKICRKAVDNFIFNENYAFHKYHDQLEREFSCVIGKSLNESIPESGFWCSTADISMTVLGVQTYLFYVIKFDRNRLNNSITFNKERHPLIEELRIEWELRFGKYFSMTKKINYNELFRRASARERFLYNYQDDLNALSAMKYENKINRGSIMALQLHRDDSYEEITKNYDISLRLSAPIKITPENYKTLRKLLEITQKELSLLMNDQGEVFAIGKMGKQPSRTYYKICFTNFLEWKFYKNGEEYLRFSNMLPSFPEMGTGIQQEDIERLIMTFGDSHLSKLEEIIEGATNQSHGTMVVFAENAEEEANRLAISGIRISPTVMIKELVESATSIDGALICDEKGKCYAIGTILDGDASDIGDPSRGARYNSALRYRNQQKSKGKKTFIVVVSEDKYINCISTEVD